MTDALVGQLLARSQVARDLLVNDRVLRQLAQLLLSIRITDRIVVVPLSSWLVNLLYLARIVLNVL